MSERPEDLCPQPPEPPELSTVPQAAPLYAASVYACRDPDQAAGILSGSVPGYVYRRNGHPNADMLAEQCRRLHGAERAAIAASGQAAMVAVLLSQLAAGDHLLVSTRMYGTSQRLFLREAVRLGMRSELVDTCDLAATEAALTDRTRLLVAETITNPRLRVPDIGRLAELAHRGGGQLLIDNTFASPVLCRPLEHGADLVVESLSKIASGHADVVLGMVCGGAARWDDLPTAISGWGLAGSPHDCWLAQRGIGTLALRMRQASATALEVARLLSGRDEVAAVDYPGLAQHPDHGLAARQLEGGFGNMVTFTLRGGLPAAEALIASGAIPFCPSLGELATTLSHPLSTSHLGLDAAGQAACGIDGGTIRLSVGIESTSHVLATIERGVAAKGLAAR